MPTLFATLLTPILAMAGIVTAGQLLSFTPYAVLCVFVAAAILTPPDVVSQLFLAIPMIALYLLGVGAAYLVGRRKSRETTTSELTTDH